MNTTEAPVKEGDVLAGKYRVERILGVGGMGVVVAAMHLELEERVALKFLLPFAAKSPAIVARFAREARAVAKIKSQHVARVSDVGTLESGVPYIVMEYLEGRDLSEVIETDGKLPIGDAVDYVLQATEALAEAHAAGIVHRDIKPANLFLARQADGSDIIKVLDFGISKAAVVASDGPAVNTGGLTQDAEIFGSPLYMSPEQLKSSRTVDPRADIWALGVILYELIAGKSPFDRPTVAETFGSILHEKPVPLRDIDPTVPLLLDAAVLRCLDRDLDARFSNVGGLSKALFPFASSATRQSLDRTSRILKRAGIPVESVPPPPVAPVEDLDRSGSPPTAMIHAGPRSSVASTRTAWDAADQAENPRPRARVVAITASVIVLGAVCLFALTRHKSSAHAHPAQTDHGSVDRRSADMGSLAVQGTAPSAAPEKGATIVTSASSVTPVVSVVPAPSVVPSSAPSAGPVPHKLKRPALPRAPVPKASVTAQAAPAAAPPPVKPTEDPDGFGDRK